MKIPRKNEMIGTVDETRMDESNYLAEIDRKLCDIEQCLENRRHDSVVLSLLNNTEEITNAKNMHQAVSTLSNLVKQQHTRIQDYKTKLNDCKNKMLTLSRLNNAILQELSTRDEKLRTEQVTKSKLEAELVECQSSMNILKVENDNLKSSNTIPISNEDSTCCMDNCYRDEYSTNVPVPAFVVSPISPCNSQDEIPTSISKTLFNNTSSDDDRVSILRKENIELQAHNVALTTTISHQESRFKKQLDRQQKLESLVHALQSQLQEMKETRHVEDELKYALLKEINDHNNQPVCNHLSLSRPSSTISFDPSLPIHEKIQILENALSEERNYSQGLRQQLDVATIYLRDLTPDDKSKNSMNLHTPSKIPYHRTVIMKSMLPTSSSSRSSEKGQE